MIRGGAAADPRRMPAPAPAALSAELARALAIELDAALAADPEVDELAFLPSTAPTDVFGRDVTRHPPAGP